MTPTIRLAQSLFVAYIGVFGLLTAFGNITDYGSNFAFVQHVMSMDTIFPESHLRYRAITSPALHHAAYWLIILGEALTGLLCSVGVEIEAARRCLHAEVAVLICGSPVGGKLSAV
jgi:predicted small integral membrane protein